MLKKVQAFPLEGIFLDLIMIGFAQVQPLLRTWVLENLLWAFWLTGTMQCVGLACALYGRSGSAEEPRGLMKFLVGFAPLLSILAAGGFLWLFLPAVTLDTQAAWFAFTAQFFISLFGGVLVVGLSMELGHETLSFKMRILTSVGAFLALAFSEAVIAACAATGKVDAGIALFALCMSYLPVRLTMAIRPPWSLLEVLSALVAFGYIAALFFR